MENLGNGIFQVETVLTDPGESDGFKFIFGRDTWDGIRFAWGLCRLWQGGSDRKNNMVGNDGNGDGTYSIRVNTVGLDIRTHENFTRYFLTLPRSGYAA